jgi:hypothetical protein
VRRAPWHTSEHHGSEGFKVDLDDNDLAEVIRTLAERERMNTLTLAHISTLCRNILAELCKPAPEDSPLVKALQALVAQGRRQEELLKHLNNASVRIETAIEAMR